MPMRMVGEDVCGCWCGFTFIVGMVVMILAVIYAGCKSSNEKLEHLQATQCTAIEVHVE